MTTFLYFQESKESGDQLILFSSTTPSFAPFFCHIRYYCHILKYQVRNSQLFMSFQESSSGYKNETSDGTYIDIQVREDKGVINKQ